MYDVTGERVTGGGHVGDVVEELAEATTIDELTEADVVAELLELDVAIEIPSARPPTYLCVKPLILFFLTRNVLLLLEPFIIPGLNTRGDGEIFNCGGLLDIDEHLLERPEQVLTGAGFLEELLSED
jgi:type III secretion system FlhB-like substrate exporter